MRAINRSAAWALTVAVNGLALGCSDAAQERLETESVKTLSAALQGPNGINADIVTDSSWGQGYCVRVVLTNQHPTASTGTWSVALNLGQSTTFSTWDGVFSGNTGAISVGPQANAVIAPGGSTQFGFCASRPNTSVVPVLVSVASDLPPANGVTVAEYKLSPAVDAEINPALPVELWASLHRPATLQAGRRYPLLVLMHGNHATCGRGSSPRIDDNSLYSETGACPANYSVVLNHRGFDYLGEDLAARGYFVVSVNTNRGVNGVSGPASDPQLLVARGRLLLRHLEQLSQWNAGATTPASLGVSLADRIDFDQVGLLGHSRGGEGVRLAYNEYRRSGSPWPARIGTAVNFRGIFEIGPTDELVAGSTIEALGTRWNVLLPACDWDLRDLDGIRVFDRMLSASEPAVNPKSFYHVWGANHNYYNSEWQIPDAGGGGTITGCINHTPLFNPAEFGSAAQRETARLAVSRFFTASVGAERQPADDALFDPAFALPVSYRVNRGWHPGGDETEYLMLEDFLGPTGTSSYGLPNQAGGGLDVEHSDFHVSPHDPSLTVGLIEIPAPSSAAFFQTNFAAPAAGFDLTSYDFLDVRADRNDSGDAEPPVDFLVQLVNEDDTLSSFVSIDQFVDLLPAPRSGSGRTLQTARIPLSMFSGAQLGAVRAVRFTFPEPIEFGLMLANIRATRATTPAGAHSPATLASPRAGAPSVAGPAATLTAPAITAGNTIESVTRAGADSVRITLRSAHFFEPRAKSLVLSIGTEQTTVARHAAGDLYGVEFVLPRAAFDRLGQREPVRVDYGPDSPTTWDFGTLDKRRLRFTGASTR